MHNDEKRIAVFIDFENVAMGVKESKHGDFNIELVLRRLVEKGKIMVKRAYSDWHRYAEFKRAFHQAAIELIDVPQTRYSGKNSADIRMVVDALDLSYQKEHIDTFVLVSGDSDFSPLVSKLRENGRYVIGMGVKQSSSDLLINNCDEFIFYEDLVRPTEAVPVVDPKLHHLSPKKAEAIRLVMETYQALQREGKEVIYGSMIKQTLIRKLPSFNENYYGYPMFSRLLEDAAENNLIRLTKDHRSGGYVVTIPAEAPGAVAEGATAPTEGGQEGVSVSEASRESVSLASTPASVDPRDRFRRSRWERGRSSRAPYRAGESSRGVSQSPVQPEAASSEITALAAADAETVEVQVQSQASQNVEAMATLSVGTAAGQTTGEITLLPASSPASSESQAPEAQQPTHEGTAVAITSTHHSRSYRGRGAQRFRSPSKVAPAKPPRQERSPEKTEPELQNPASSTADPQTAVVESVRVVSSAHSDSGGSVEKTTALSSVPVASATAPPASKAKTPRGGRRSPPSRGRSRKAPSK